MQDQEFQPLQTPLEASAMPHRQETKPVVIQKQAAQIYNTSALSCAALPIAAVLPHGTLARMHPMKTLKHRASDRVQIEVASRHPMEGSLPLPLDNTSPMASCSTCQDCIVMLVMPNLPAPRHPPDALPSPQHRFEHCDGGAHAVLLVQCHSHLLSVPAGRGGKGSAGQRAVAGYH